MKSIKNIPLTRTIDLDLNIVEERKIKLADSDIENENLKKKLKKIVEVASKIKGVIVTGGRGEEQFVMANITPSKKRIKH